MRASGRRRTWPFGAVWSAFGAVRMSFSTRSARVQRRKRPLIHPCFEPFQGLATLKRKKTRARDSVASAGRRKRGRMQRHCGPRPSKPGYDRIRFSANICSPFPMTRRVKPTPVPSFGAKAEAARPERLSAIGRGRAARRAAAAPAWSRGRPGARSFPPPPGRTGRAGADRDEVGRLAPGDQQQLSARPLEPFERLDGRLIDAPSCASAPS